MTCEAKTRTGLQEDIKNNTGRGRKNSYVGRAQLQNTSQKILDGHMFKGLELIPKCIVDACGFEKYSYSNSTLLLLNQS